MEGNQSNHPLFVQSQGDPRLVDVDGGVILEVSDFYEEGNPKVFFDCCIVQKAFLDGQFS